MACTPSNKCAKNLSKRTVLPQLIIKNVVTCFLEHSVDGRNLLTTVDIQSIVLLVPKLKKNKNLAIANKSRVSCAHNTSKASIGLINQDLKI